MRIIRFATIFVSCIVLSHTVNVFGVDSEPDGMPDDWEAIYGLNTALDDSQDDPDNDGLTNIREFEAGSYPSDPDSDNDGLPDGQEIQRHLACKVNITTDDLQDTPVVVAGSDKFLISWTSYNQDGSGGGVYAKSVTPDGAVIDTEFRVNTTTSGHQYFSMVASNGSSYCIAWAGQSQTGKPDGKYAQFFAGDVSISGSELMVDQYISNLRRPMIATNGSNYMIVGCTHRASNDWDIIYACTIDNDGTAGTTFQVNTNTLGNHWQPVIGSNGSSYLVVWFQDGADGDSYGIFGQIVDASGAKIGSEVCLNSYTTDSQWYPQIASNGSSYFVVWESVEQDGSLRGIYGRILGNTGTKIGSEIAINTYTQNDQSTPRIASVGDNYLVCWTSYGQDGSDNCVIGQCIAPDGRKIGGEQIINTITPSNQNLCKVVSNGNYVIILWDSWDFSGTDTSGLFGSFLNEYAVPVGTSFQITTQLMGGDYKQPDCAVIGDTFCIVYPYVDSTWDIGAMITPVTFATNPTNTDSDSDFMPDGWEAAAGLNPLLNDSDSDPDNDGLSNIEEYGNNTNPYISDTDNDGMNDGDEVTAGMNPNDASSLFALRSISRTGSDTIAISWNGPVSNPNMPYSIRWFETFDGTSYTFDPDNDALIIDNGIRSWTDEGDNDTPTRSAPVDCSMRFYQVIVQ